MTFSRRIVQIKGRCENYTPPKGVNVLWIEHGENCIGVFWASDSVELLASDRVSPAQFVTLTDQEGTVLASHPKSPATVGSIQRGNTVIEEG